MNKTTHDLVKNIEPTIRNVDRRQKRMVTSRLFLVALATFLILLFTGLALDYLFAWRSPLMRWIFPLLAFAGTIWLGAKVFLSFGRREQLDRSVRDIDSAYPALEERWSTVTNLSASKDSDAVKGSPELLAQVANEASGFTEQVSATQVVTHQSIRKPGLTVLLASVALLALFVALSQFSGKLSKRFFSPWNPVTLTEIQGRHHRRPTRSRFRPRHHRDHQRQNPQDRSAYYSGRGHQRRNVPPLRAQRISPHLLHRKKGHLRPELSNSQR